MHVGVHVIVTHAAVVSTLVVNDHRHGGGVFPIREETCRPSWSTLKCLVMAAWPVAEDVERYSPGNSQVEVCPWPEKVEKMIQLSEGIGESYVGCDVESLRRMAANGEIRR